MWSRGVSSLDGAAFADPEPCVDLARDVLHALLFGGQSARDMVSEFGVAGGVMGGADAVAIALPFVEETLRRATFVAEGSDRIRLSMPREEQRGILEVGVAFGGCCVVSPMRWKPGLDAAAFSCLPGASCREFAVLVCRVVLAPFGTAARIGDRL